MTNTHIAVGTIILTVLFCAYYFSRTAIIKRQLRKTPVKPVADIKDGETYRITGMAELVGEPLIAPLSGRECCYYNVVVQEEQGGENTSWQTIIDVAQKTDYVINDNGHYAHITSEELMALVVKDHERSSRFLKDATPEMENFLRQHGRKSENWLGMNRDLRYEEGIIEHCEKVTVMGTGTWLPAADLNLPEHYNKVLSITPNPKKKFVFLSDDAGVVGK